MAEKKIVYLETLADPVEPIEAAEAQPEDILVGLIRLTTKVAVGFIFQQQGGIRHVAEVMIDHTPVSHDASHIWAVASEQLLGRFRGVLPLKTLLRVESLLRQFILPPDHVLRSEFSLDPSTRNDDLQPLFGMPLGKFDELYRLIIDELPPRVQDPAVGVDAVIDKASTQYGIFGPVEVKEA